MEKYSAADDVYRQLVDESDESWLYGLVAFAVVEEQRIEWARHWTETKGNAPNADEIAAWYEQQPEGVLLRAKGTAENALQAYSSDVVDAVLEDQKGEIERGIIVGEIRSQNRFWPQFGVNFVSSLAGAIVFAGLLILVAFFVFNDASPVEIGKELVK